MPGVLPPSASATVAAPDAAERAALAWCRRHTRKRARNFYYGMMLTPEPKRSAMYTVYAVMRACDDLADAREEEDGADRPRRQVEVFRARLEAALTEGRLPEDEAEAPLWRALRWAARRFELPQAPFDEMLDGQLQDLAAPRMASFEDLRTYCRRVAGTVGRVCIAVWGYEGGAETQRLAEERGIALQLTNILRDVVEDAHRGRVYLPLQELRDWGLTPHGLTQGEAGFDGFLQMQIRRAREHHERAAALEQRVAPDCRPTCRALTGIYRGLLEKIAADPRRVLRERVRLTTPEKLAVAARALWRG
jgi:phytoene synthase